MSISLDQSFFSRFDWPESIGDKLPFAIGHRGTPALETENTLGSFARAAELGARMWELDTQLTRDGVCVVSHDDALERVFGVDATISQMTAADLANLDGVAVPLFADVAALAREKAVGLYVELKAAGTGLLAWSQLRANNQRFAAFGSFDPMQVRELRQAGCTYPLAVLVPVGADPFALAEFAGADLVHLCWEQAGERPQDLVTPTLIEEARRRNLEIVLWHEERPAVISDLLELPVLGICSDEPSLLVLGDNRGSA